MSETVRLELTGRILGEIHPEVAIQRLAQTLKIDLARAQELIQNAPTIIKKQLPAHQANHYQQVFSKMGLELVAIPLSPTLTRPFSLELDPIVKPVAKMEALETPPSASDSSVKSNLNMPAQSPATVADMGEEPFYTPSMFAKSLEGRLGCNRYLVYMISVLIPVWLIFLFSPDILERYLAASNGSVTYPVAFLLLSVVWHFFRCTVLRLHDLNLSGYWAILITVLFFGSQNINDLWPALSYMPYLVVRIFGLLLLIGLVVWPGTEGDNLYGVPAEPPAFAQQAIAIGVIAIASLIGLYQLANSHMQYVFDKARNNIELSEQEIQYLFKAERPQILASELRLAIEVEEQDSGPVRDHEAFRQRLQQQLDATKMSELRTLQRPLLASDIPESERPMVTEKALDQYVKDTTELRNAKQNREVARRELQKNYDNQTRKKRMQ
jgi:uncharacterized membrane protein YhaH (DUF805 family)